MKRSIVLCLMFIVTLASPLLYAAEEAKPSAQVSALQEILILNSYHPGFEWSDDEQAGVIDVFRAKDTNWLPVIEYLDLKRLPDGRHLAELKKLFRSKYQNKNLSMVIAMDNRALEFAIENQTELFGNAPIVFCGINNYTPSLLKGRSNVTGIAESIDLAGTIEIMLRLHPAAREIFVLHDYTASVLAVRKELEALVPRFGAKVRFRFTDPLTMEELLKELERLPKDSLVLEIGFVTDISGRTFGMTEAVRLFFEHSPVPIYSTYEQRLGFGIVGGKLLSARHHGTHAGRIALRVLAGEKASAIPVVFESDSQFMFDYKVMSRFGIPLSVLPEGSMVINKPVSFYAAHRSVILTGLGAIAFLTIIISLLTIHILQKRRSVIALRASKEALKLEYAMLQAGLDYSPALISIKDLKGNVILANRNIAVLDAPPLRELVGKNIFDLFPREVAENLWNNDLAALKAGGPVESEEIVKHKDGNWHTYLTVKFPVYIEPGHPFGICAISTDITERKRVAGAFMESEQNYRLLATYHKGLNDISIAFIEASGTEDLFNRISESLRSITGAIAATFSVYNRDTQALKVVSLSTDPISSDKISSFFGPGLFEMRMPVSTDDMEHMLSQGIRRPKDLCELSFGVMPQDISDAVMDAVACRQIVALAITYAGELFGTCVAYLPGDQPVVPDDALKTYISLSGLAIKRKQMEEALRESEARYRQVVEHAPAAIFEADLTTGRLLSVNEVLCEYSGYTRDELLALHPLDLMTEESQKLILQRMAGYTAGEPVPPAVEYKGRNKSGCEFWISVNAKYFYRAGLPVRATVIAYDITDRKKAEEALHRSEENFRRSLDESPLGVRIVTEDGETIYANRAILDIGDFDSIEELNSTPLRKRYTPESYAEFRIRREKRKRGDPVPSKYEVSIVRKDGEVRHLYAFRKEILWNGEKQFQAIYQDITERKRAEVALRASREQMRALAGRLQAVREEDRTNMARAIHDELGGALTGLKIDFSLLTRAALKIENKTVRTSLLTGMNSMIKSIDSTIQTVRRIAMELRPGVLDDLGLVAALEWQIKDFEKRTGVRCEYFPPVEDIGFDADLSTALFRIFQEALTNVISHSGATEVHVHLRADADLATLEVEDNGKGIKKEEAMSTKSLGLLGMRERAQMFGGRFTITGAPGKGTKVTVEVSPVEKRRTDREEGGSDG